MGGVMTPEERKARARQRRRIEIKRQLDLNEGERKRLLDARDRKIIESVDAGDSPTVIARDTGLNRAMVYVIHTDGRDRKGAITT